MVLWELLRGLWPISLQVPNGEGSLLLSYHLRPKPTLFYVPLCGAGAGILQIQFCVASCLV